MAMELPAAPRVYTTTYDNFRGVDFTNDATNVWRRRSPTGVNMLPDASGRPFKRTGWEILLSNADLCDALGQFAYAVAGITEEYFDSDKTRYFTLDDDVYVRCTDEDVFDNDETYYYREYGSCTINKCAWFELAGKDHIVVFTDCGVVFYNGSITATSTDPDCYPSYDRCFFFEGGGTSAFYIYGNFRMWRYDSSFTLTEVTDELYVPTVLISTSADGVGTVYQGYNLLGNLIKIQYHDADLFTYWGTDGLVFTVDKATYISVHTTKNYSQKYTYDGADWKDESETTVDFSTLGITVSSIAQEGDEIFVVYANGVVLPNNVDITSQSDKVKVFGSTALQFDTEMIQVASSPSVGEFALHTDSVTREERKSWIEFNAGQTFAYLGEEDIIEVTSPSSEVKVTPITSGDNGNAELDGEVI